MFSGKRYLIVPRTSSSLAHKSLIFGSQNVSYRLNSTLYSKSSKKSPTWFKNQSPSSNDKNDTLRSLQSTQKLLQNIREKSDSNIMFSLLESLLPNTEQLSLLDNSVSNLIVNRSSSNNNNNNSSSIIRSSLPPPLTDMSPESINLYLQNLSSNIYQGQNPKVREIIDILVSNETVQRMLTKKTYVSLTRYYAINRMSSRLYYIKNEIYDNNDEYDADFYTVLFEIQGLKSITAFNKYLSEMVVKEMKVNSRILRSLYTILKYQDKELFKEKLQTVDLNPDVILKGLDYPQDINDPDELVLYVTENKLELTKNLMNQIVKLYLRADRVYEAWYFTTKSLHFENRRIEYTTGYLFIDYFIKRNELFLILPFCKLFLFNHGLDITDYGATAAINKLIESTTTKIDKNWEQQASIFFLLAVNDSKGNSYFMQLKQKLRAHMKIHKRNGDKTAIVKNKTEVYKRLKFCYSKMLWTLNKPLFEVELNNEDFITCCSYFGYKPSTPNDKSIHKQLFNLIGSKGAQSGWDYIVDNRIVMTRNIALVFIRHLIHNNESHFAIAMQNYVEEKHGINVKFETYSLLAESLTNHPVTKSVVSLVVGLYTKTWWNAGLWSNEFKIKYNDLVRSNEYPNFDIDAQQSKADETFVNDVLSKLRWNNDEPNFNLEEQSSEFRLVADYVTRPDVEVNSQKIQELLSKNDPTQAWIIAETTGMSRSIAILFVDYFVTKKQLYNVYALSRWFRTEYDLIHLADFYCYEVMIRSIMSEEKLNRKNISLLKIIRDRSKYLEAWNDATFQSVLKNRLERQQLSIDWTLNNNEASLAEMMIKNLKWKGEIPEFSLNENPQSFIDAAAPLI
ncbi:hypothetical protein CANARDRAFT_30031 [[Candida] arabinofermentans NRRL YB-2248]|uniref:Uncharacterized protein n=1 Tax=[Candida] arabinofermentans NRRL YB-2248 TaxID=983967 RepID=A0A1E4SVD1_9ASCO|nr:hypothetical protein CANARDRAFT_30031 [[Candida] arabinofermentans NRRL YB-2248]